jgi:uncharacterized Zn-binding protein involved in type VI secretion
MGMPAARVGDMHECPMVDPGPIPHVGGPILPPAEPTVIVAGMPAARVGDLAQCVPRPDTIADGDNSVLIGGRPAARLGDKTVHGGMVIMGSARVLIGYCSCCKCVELAARNGVPFFRV